MIFKSDFKPVFNKYCFYIGLFAIMALGFLLRLKGLLATPSMWHDECALAWSVVHKNYSEFFGILGYSQVAPPFFMAASKSMTKLFGTSDVVLRIIPFISGIFSMALFYLIAKDNFKNKLTVLIAMFLFAVSQALINYSFEFKQYGLDVFCTLLCLYFFQKLDIEKISFKKLLVSALGLGLIIWFSFVSVFVIAGGLLITFSKNVKKNWRQKTILSMPIILSLLLYLIFYLAHTHSGPVMISYWADKFISYNFSNFLYLLVENIKYFFFPIKFVLFAFILLIWGLLSGLKGKNKIVQLIFATILFLIISSVLHIYPFYSRLVLFLLPLFLILTLTPLDNISGKNKIKSGIIILITIFAFYQQIPAAINLIKLPTLGRGEHPCELMDFMAKNIKQGDIIFVNSASDVEFDYYSSFYPINNKIVQERVTDGSSSKYIEFLNQLPKGNYWFYLPYDSSNAQVFSYLLPWLKTNVVINSKVIGKSILVYVSIN